MTNLYETAETIFQRREVTAEAVLEQRADLRAYPHHYLRMTSDANNRSDGLHTITIAVDYLRHYGWQLVTITVLDGTVIATVGRDLTPPQADRGESHA